MQGGKRFYIKQGPGNGDLVLSGAEHNHLANVLRLKTGDDIIAVCGDEFDYHYKIRQITKNQSFLNFAEKWRNLFNPKAQLVVYLGVIKFDNLVLSVQKLNEIGVTEIVLFNSANCNIPAKSVNISKLQTIAEQSCKQCGRSIPVKVRGVLDFNQMVKELPNGALFCDEAESCASIASADIKTSAAVVIGCEGGFIEKERTELKKTAKSVSLGKRILRAETAAITAASIILSKLGEL